MTPADRQAYLNQDYLKPGAAKTLSNKAQKELWKQVNEANLPLRRLPRPRDNQWGQDKNGRGLGDYPIQEYEEHTAKKTKLVLLLDESWVFKNKRAKADNGDLYIEGDTVKPFICTDEDVEAEKARRQEMAELRQDLYGVKLDTYALDPEWDDVVPIPQIEPDKALAAIAYPDDYAEGMFSTTLAA